jgi:hypothetical protein
MKQNNSGHWKIPSSFAARSFNADIRAGCDLLSLHGLGREICGQPDQGSDYG